MSLYDVFDHCDQFCEITTPNRKVSGVLFYLYANWFLVRSRTGGESADVVVDAHEILSVTPR